MVRVISGKYKRINLIGYDAPNIRPTMDKVKESIFGMIYHYIDNGVCLDLFCGTGSLGIEALSNGSKFVYFVDKESTSVNITKTNLSKIKENNYSVICSDYTDAIKRFSNIDIKFDIIFIDPPYGKIKIKDVIDKIIQYNILNENGLLICEYESEELEINDLTLIKDRKYGRVNIRVYKR